MKILITGSAGFIGYHLTRSYLQRGIEVVGIDNFVPAYPTLIKYKRKEKLEKDFSAFKHITMDLNDPKLQGVVKDFQPDVVCNLAAVAGVRDSIEHPHRFIKCNINGFLNLLEAIKESKNPARLVYASSSSVYGKQEIQPLVETQRIDTPISLYAATKASNELMAHCYSELFGIQTIGLRFFTVYGTWGRPDMALWIFTEKILNNEPLPIFGYGKMKRDFSYIDDIVEGITAACETPALPKYEIYNLGNDKSEGLLDLVATIEKATKKVAVKNLLPMQLGDVVENHVDVSRAKQDLGFQNKINISEGVPKFVAWYREHPEIAEDVKNWRS